MNRWAIFTASLRDACFPRTAYRPLFLCLLLAAFCLLPSSFSRHEASPAYRGSQEQKTEIASIDAYVGQTDRFIKHNPKALRIFGNLASGARSETSRWRKFRNERERQQADAGDNLNENAYVWMKKGRVIGANFTFQSGSRDWVHFVMYYFRDDGTLAKIDAQLNTFHGHTSAFREQFYNRQGRLLKSKEKFKALGSQKAMKPTDDFVDEPIPVYLNVRKLPFHKLL